MRAFGWSAESLLPHSGEMVLLDEVIEIGETHAHAAVRIGEDSPFFVPKLGIPVWVGLEYMAQAVGLTAGYKARIAGREVAIGFLLGTRSFSATVPAFRLGEKLMVSVAEVWQDDQMAVFECTVEARSVLAQSRINVFQPADFQAFLREKGL